MKKKLIVDILLFILMILEFSRMYMPTILHELIGILLFVLIIMHLILNSNYIKNINKGKYNLKRIIVLIINIVFMISFMLSIIFGILSSNDLFIFININNMNIIMLHKCLSYISLICMGLHLGINYIVFDKFLNKIKSNIILYITKIAIIILGIYSWINLDIWNHLTGKYGFSIVKDNLFINILEYLSIVIMITFITDFIYKRLGKKM